MPKEYNDNKPHILVISQYFHPEQFRVNDICTEWVKRGYKVTVVTGIPNYPQGKFYSGYGFFKKRRDNHHGIRIIRLPIISRGKSGLRLALNYLSFVVSGFFWKSFTQVKADCVYIHEVSPMSQTLVGVWYARRRHIPNIHYVTDLWPENVEILGGTKSKTILKWLGQMVDYIYRHNNKILTSSRSFMPAIEARGISAEKLEFWPHYAEDFYTEPWIEKEHLRSLIHKEAGVFNIIFTGNHGEAQGLLILPEVARLLKMAGVSACFNMVGDGRAKQALIDAVNAADVADYFNFIPWQKAGDIPQLLSYADAALMMLRDSPIFKMTIPTKLQSYMACAVPILVSGNGEMNDIVSDSGSGLCAPAGDAAALAERIAEMKNLCKEELHAMRARASEYYRMHFDKEKLLNRMDDILHEAIVTRGVID